VHVRNKGALPRLDIGRIAARQHGVVTLAQLEEVGLTRYGVARRVGDGYLLSVHRGVYAVGHSGLSRGGRWMAAVLALGPDAALSHMSAAALGGLLRPEGGLIAVSLPSNSGRRRRAGIRVHRCASLQADQISERYRIPVTTPARTIEDLRAIAPPHLVRRATRQAELAGYPLGPGARVDGTRSDLELDFLAFCDQHRLPRPRVNVRIGRWTVDFLWRAERLAVETDFFDHHRGSVAFEDDHQRDLDLRGAGYAVRRYTGAQIRNHPAAVVADLREVLRLPAS
jgi:very-short-patch-repair endonuclease